MPTRFHLCAMLIAMPVVAGAATPIAGTWRLDEVVMPNTYSASPAGVEARKEVYTRDGQLCVIAADANRIDPSAPCLEYRIEDGHRIITDADGKEYTASLAFNGADQLDVTQDGGSEWHYSRLTGANAAATKLEPVSVEVLKTQRNLPALAHDSHDYSSLPPARRLTGVWEVVAHGNVDPQEAPPYGFLNDLWIFDGKAMARIERPQAGDAIVAGGKLPYAVDGSTLTSPGMPSIRFSFNAWGHLILDLDGQTIRLKLIDKHVEKPRLPPLKIVLTRLADAPDGT